MFDSSGFSGDISRWNLKSVEHFENMFANAKSQVCTLDPIKNKFDIMYQKAVSKNTNYRLQFFKYMFYNWDIQNIPQWFKDLIIVGKQYHYDLHHYD